MPDITVKEVFRGLDEVSEECSSENWDVSFEWYRSPEKVVSVSINPGGEICYAAIIGTRRKKPASARRFR